ncbi:hypothetical protein [Marinibacterium profundimaris]|uniref:Uncharacterized protein n=1 Tax=Marinibacterium profundimaris TaxID=1679460 RepID=A0A225NNL4_9RHOB|nr:hypothetical protein [Marinibacterium profundimaris]OWU75973.1 hypothetical protein ATO3_07305 [Marinibacterium profundimaris]
MRRSFLAVSVLSLSAALPAHADDVTDALQNAITSYEEGDIGYAMEELDYAKQLMASMKADALTGFLPEAPDGWTREVNTEMGAGLAMMGGGTGAEADYSSDSGSFTITLMADNPMVAGMAAALGNAGAMGAKIERVGREKFMVQDSEITGLIDKRILVQAKGDDIDMMLDLLKSMDFKSLADFGR